MSTLACSCSASFCFLFSAFSFKASASWRFRSKSFSLKANSLLSLDTASCLPLLSLDTTSCLTSFTISGTFSTSAVGLLMESMLRLLVAPFSLGTSIGGGLEINVVSDVGGTKGTALGRRDAAVLLLGPNLNGGGVGIEIVLDSWLASVFSCAAIGSLTGVSSTVSVGAGGVVSAGLGWPAPTSIVSDGAWADAESCISFNCSDRDFSFDRRSRIIFWNSRSLSRSRSLRLLAPSNSVLADLASFSILLIRCFISSSSFWAFDPTPDDADNTNFSLDNCSISFFCDSIFCRNSLRCLLRFWAIVRMREFSSSVVFFHALWDSLACFISSNFFCNKRCSSGSIWLKFETKLVMRPFHDSNSRSRLAFSAVSAVTFISISRWMASIGCAAFLKVTSSSCVDLRFDFNCSTSVRSKLLLSRSNTSCSSFWRVVAAVFDSILESSDSFSFAT